MCADLSAGQDSVVRFRKGAQLDPSQVQDVRGRGMGLPGGGIAVGGGGIGLVALLAIVLINVLTGGGSVLDDLAGTAVDRGAPQSEALADCRTGADANASEDCRIVGYVNSIQRYWTDEFQRSNRRYEPSVTRFFDGQISTGCGVASSEVGPFYCPGTMCRTCSATSTAPGKTRREPRAPRSGPSCRRIATPACGLRTQSRPATSRTSPRPTSPTASTRLPLSATTASSSGHRGA